MHLGKLGDTSGLLIRRKFLRTFRAEFPHGKLPERSVKINSRTNINIEELQNEKGEWIPGKTEWSSLKTTYMDVDSEDPKELYKILTAFYDVSENGKLDPEQKTELFGTGFLKLYDGCGIEIERWELYELRPQIINFGELDCSSSSYYDLEVTWRFNEVKYIPAKGYK